MQRHRQNNFSMNMRDHDPHKKMRQDCCIAKIKPSSHRIWDNQAICSSAGRGNTFLQTGTVTDKIIGLCRSHLHLEHLVRCSCEHFLWETSLAWFWTLSIISSNKIHYTILNQCAFATWHSYFICSDDGNSSKSCQWYFACYTIVKELHGTLPLYYSCSWKEHLK